MVAPFFSKNFIVSNIFEFRRSEQFSLKAAPRINILFELKRAYYINCN